MAPLNHSSVAIVVTRDQFFAVYARTCQQDLGTMPTSRGGSARAAVPEFQPPPGLELPPNTHSKVGGGGRPLSGLEPPRGTKTEAGEVMQPPPGLERSTRVSAEERSMKTQKESAKPRIVDLPSQVQEGFQVLLRGLSDKLTQEAMMQVVLEQAGLARDVLRLDFRPGGQALISFAAMASVQRCINHFNGRAWGFAGAPISALYVRSVPNVEGLKVREAPARVKRMSADAPVFVMPSISVASDQEAGADPLLSPAKCPLSASDLVFGFSSSLSAAAERFVPQGKVGCGKLGKRSRKCSETSTEAGFASDGAFGVDDDDSASESTADSPFGKGSA